MYASDFLKKSIVKIDTWPPHKNISKLVGGTKYPSAMAFIHPTKVKPKGWSLWLKLFFQEFDIVFLSGVDNTVFTFCPTYLSEGKIFLALKQVF